MDTTTRMRANAILDRLVSDDETFSSIDAQWLIRTLPITKSSWIEMAGNYTRSGGSFEGVAAGSGTPIGQEEEKVTSFEVGRHRIGIGGYRLMHRPGFIEISSLWHDTHEVEPPKARLIYDRRTAAPEKMMISGERVLRLGPVSLSRTFWHFWKNPG